MVCQEFPGVIEEKPVTFFRKPRTFRSFFCLYMVSAFERSVFVVVLFWSTIPVCLQVIHVMGRACRMIGWSECESPQIPYPSESDFNHAF